jgi:hypothetical protein
MSGQSVWDTFTYTVKNSNGSLDTRTVQALIGGLNEPISSQTATLSPKTGVGTIKPATVAAKVMTTSLAPNTLALSAALQLATADSSLGYRDWLCDFDLLSGNGQKSKTSKSLVDAAIRGPNSIW